MKFLQKEPVHAKKKSSRVSLLILSLIFGSTTSLVVAPRATTPLIVPLPFVDERYQAELEAVEFKRAIRARDDSLENSIRSVGEGVRRLGSALAQGNALASRQAAELQKDVKRLIESDKSEDLLSLRALQGELFVQAVHRWVAHGCPAPPEVDLLELGGVFTRIAQASWLNDESKLVLNDAELRLFFRLRWGKLVGVHGSQNFGPSLEELRRYYKTNLKNPLVNSKDPRSKALAQVQYAHALGQVDPHYPANLALGILHLQLGEHEKSQGLLEAHLKSHPDGPWANIARNHLLLASRHTQDQHPFVGH